LLAMFTLNSWH